LSSRRQEIQVGLTVLVALVLLLWGLAWLKDFASAANTRLYKVSFPQAGGLSPSDEVLVNGMRKGKVQSMSLVGDHVEVGLLLSKDVELTTDSKVSIRNVGLMGEKVIAVDLKNTGNKVRPDEMIQGEYELGVAEVMAQLGGTVDAVALLADRLVEVSDMLNQDGRLASTLKNFNRTSEELRLVVSENRAKLNETFDNLSSASKTAKALTTDKEAELKAMLDRFSELSVRLDSLRVVIHSLATKVDSGEGTIGKLVNDDKLYTDLNESVTQLRFLIEDIKKNPKKYFKVSVF
jgi:phospholipid/cholesterol/gamma-HCH transport system substrate-binding protein